MPSPKIKIRKKPTNKRCQDGYPCKTTCISRLKNCRTPLNGQATTLTLWLKHQEEMLEITNKKRARVGLSPATITKYGYITAERNFTGKKEVKPASPIESKAAIASPVADEQSIGELFDNQDWDGLIQRGRFGGKILQYHEAMRLLTNTSIPQSKYKSVLSSASKLSRERGLSSSTGSMFIDDIYNASQQIKSNKTTKNEKAKAVKQVIKDAAEAERSQGYDDLNESHRKVVALNSMLNAQISKRKEHLASIKGFKSTGEKVKATIEQRRLDATNKKIKQLKKDIDDITQSSVSTSQTAIASSNTTTKSPSTVNPKKEPSQIEKSLIKLFQEKATTMSLEAFNAEVVDGLIMRNKGDYKMLTDALGLPETIDITSLQNHLKSLPKPEKAPTPNDRADRALEPLKELAKLRIDPEVADPSPETKPVAEVQSKTKNNGNGSESAIAGQQSSARLSTLEASLEKKKAVLDSKFENHFKDVARANGQPLNDKRNGQQTLDRWDKQSDSIRMQKEKIAKTEAAIERERTKIANVESAKGNLPKHILDAVENGELTQWRKHPNFFFVPGVDKARIVFDKGVIKHRYLSEVTDKEQYKKFAQTYNKLKNMEKEGENPSL